MDVYTSTYGHFNGTKYPPNLRLCRLKTYGVVWGMNPLANTFGKIVDGDYDIVHVHSYVFFMSNTAAMARAFDEFKYILNFHGGIDYTNDNSLSMKLWAKDKLYDPTLGRMTVGLADKVISICRKDIPAIRDKFGVTAEYVPNAVCTDTFDYKETNDDTVVFVGKLERWKGAQDLIDIFQRVKRACPSTRFKVVGEGSLQKDLAATKLPIDFSGYIHHENMPQIYHNASVSILPSYMEGSPTTCIEAGSCGVPVVATDVGDTKEIVKNGVSGFIFKPGDKEGMANAIINLLDKRSKRREMGLCAREHITNHFSYDAIANQMAGIYASVASGTAR